MKTRRRSHRRSKRSRRRAIISHVVRYRRNPVGRRGRRRGRQAGGGGAITLRSLTQPDLLWTAGGAVAGSFLTNIVMDQFGPYKLTTSGVRVAKGAGEFKLPLSDQPFGWLLYNITIPVIGAILAQRFNRNLARGMVIGAGVMGVNAVIQFVRGMTAPATTTAATSAYLDAGGRIKALPAGPGYNAVNAFSAIPGAVNPLDNSGAFRQNTWAIARN